MKSATMSWRKHARIATAAALLGLTAATFQAFGKTRNDAATYFRAHVVPAMKAKDDRQTEAALTHCLELNPRYYRALCAYGLYAFGKGDWSKATDYLNKAQAVAPNAKVAAALKTMSDAAQKTQESDSSEQASKARQYSGHLFMAKVFMQRKSYDLALKESDKAISLDPSLWQGYVSKAAASRGLRHSADVKQNLSKAVQLAPDSAKPKIQAELNKVAKL